MNFISQYFTQCDIEMYLKQRFEKNSNSFNKSCPFCNSVINTKSYIKKHIRNFCCAINPTNSIKYASIYEKVQKECNNTRQRQHGHSDDDLLSQFDRFISWDYCENSDARKQIQYRIQLDNESIITIKHADLSNNSKTGSALAKRAQRMRKNGNLAFKSTNNCGNNLKENPDSEIQSQEIRIISNKKNTIIKKRILINKLKNKVRKCNYKTNDNEKCNYKNDKCNYDNDKILNNDIVNDKIIFDNDKFITNDATNDNINDKFNGIIDNIIREDNDSSDSSFHSDDNTSSNESDSNSSIDNIEEEEEEDDDDDDVEQVVISHDENGNEIWNWKFIGGEEITYTKEITVNSDSDSDFDNEIEQVKKVNKVKEMKKKNQPKKKLLKSFYNNRDNNKINSINIFTNKKVDTNSIINILNNNLYSENRKKGIKSTVNLFYDYLINTLNINADKQELMLLLISHSFDFTSYIFNTEKYSISHKRNISQNITNLLDKFTAFDERVYWVSKANSISKTIKQNVLKKMNIAYEKQRAQRSLEVVQKSEGKFY